MIPGYMYIVMDVIGRFALAAMMILAAPLSV
jgi:hypothetical protein